MTEASEEETRFTVEEVANVSPPPRARVEDDAGETETLGEKFGRKRDYLEGFLAEKPQGIGAGEPGGSIYDGVVEALKEIFDPEIPVNIYDLGLIYGVDVTGDGEVKVTMTLTTPHCPVAELMPGEVELRVSAVPGVRDAEVNLVWDPPWDMSNMSDEAKLELGDALMGSETKIRQRPAAVILTPSAEARIAKLMAQAPVDAIGVKLSTPRRGCSGLAYSVDYVTAAVAMDERIETPGGLFFIDSASVLYLIGSTMDWVEDDFTAGFTFQNPNAKGSCGCGESFTV